MTTNWLKKYDEGGMADMEMSAPEPMAPEPAKQATRKPTKGRRTVRRSTIVQGPVATTPNVVAKQAPVAPLVENPYFAYMAEGYPYDIEKGVQVHMQNMGKDTSATPVYAKVDYSKITDRNQIIDTAINQILGAETDPNKKKQLQTLLRMTNYMENKYGEADDAWKNKNVNYGFTELDKISIDNLFKPKGNKGAYTKGQKNAFEYLKNFGLPTDQKQLEKLLLDNDPLANMAVSRLVYATNPNPLPDMNDQKAVFNYWLNDYNHRGAIKHHNEDELFKIFQEGYNKYNGPNYKSNIYVGPDGHTIVLPEEQFIPNQTITAENPIAQAKNGGWLNKYQSGTTSAQPTLTFNTMPVGTVGMPPAADNTRTTVAPVITKEEKNKRALRKLQQSTNEHVTFAGKDAQGNPIIVPAAGTTYGDNGTVVAGALLAGPALKAAGSLMDVALPYVGNVGNALTIAAAPSAAWNAAQGDYTDAALIAAPWALSKARNVGNALKELSPFARRATLTEAELLPPPQQAGFINFKGAFQKYPKGPLTEEEILAYKNSPFYKNTTNQHLEHLKKYGDQWNIGNAAEEYLQRAIATGDRSQINPIMYGGDNWAARDYMLASVYGAAVPSVAGLYGLAFSPPAVRNKVFNSLGIQTVPTGLTSKDTIIDITNLPMNFSKVNQTSDGKIILGGEFIEDSNNTVRKAKDWINATDTYSDKKYPSKDIQSFYGIENGIFKVGKATDFDPNTEIVPRRFGTTNIQKAVLNGEEMRLLDEKGNPIYQNTPNTGKFILYSPSTKKSQFAYINSGKSGVDAVNAFVKENKDAQYIHLDNGRYEYYVNNPDGLNQQDFENYYEQDLRREGNPGYNLIIKKNGGWLDKYQDAGAVMPADVMMDPKKLVQWMKDHPEATVANANKRVLKDPRAVNVDPRLLRNTPKVVPAQGTIDYPASDPRSQSYTGTPATTLLMNPNQIQGQGARIIEAGNNLPILAAATAPIVVPIAAPAEGAANILFGYQGLKAAGQAVNDFRNYDYDQGLMHSGEAVLGVVPAIGGVSNVVKEASPFVRNATVRAAKALGTEKGLSSTKQAGVLDDIQEMITNPKQYFTKEQFPREEIPSYSQEFKVVNNADNSGRHIQYKGNKIPVYGTVNTGDKNWNIVNMFTVGNDTQNPRDVMHLVSDNGEFQHFYKSSGTNSGKTLGSWYPYEGYSKNGWFIKGAAPAERRSYDIYPKTDPRYGRGSTEQYRIATILDDQYPHAPNQDIRFAAKIPFQNREGVYHGMNYPEYYFNNRMTYGVPVPNNPLGGNIDQSLTPQYIPGLTFFNPISSPVPGPSSRVIDWNKVGKTALGVGVAGAAASAPTILQNYEGLQKHKNGGWLNKYEKGSKVYVSSVTDPRYTRYKDSLDLYNYYKLQTDLENPSGGIQPGRGDGSIANTLAETGNTLYNMFDAFIPLTDAQKKIDNTLFQTAANIIKNNPNLTWGTDFPAVGEDSYEAYKNAPIHSPDIKTKNGSIKATGTWMGYARNNDYSNVKPHTEVVVAPPIKINQGDTYVTQYGEYEIVSDPNSGAGVKLKNKKTGQVSEVNRNDIASHIYKKDANITTPKPVQKTTPPPPVKKTTTATVTPSTQTETTTTTTTTPTTAQKTTTTTKKTTAPFDPKRGGFDSQDGKHWRFDIHGNIVPADRNTNNGMQNGGWLTKYK